MKFLKVNYPGYQMTPVNRLLNDFLNSELYFDRFGKNELVNQPATNVHENDQAVKIEISVPGYDKKQLLVSVENDLLLVKGEAVKEQEEQGRNAHAEFRNGNFEKKFRLSDKLDADRVDAKYKNGILTITVSKKEDAIPQKREIEIS